jgi:hypothetical protein
MVRDESVSVVKSGINTHLIIVAVPTLRMVMVNSS